MSGSNISKVMAKRCRLVHKSSAGPAGQQFVGPKVKTPDDKIISFKEYKKLRKLRKAMGRKRFESSPQTAASEMGVKE